MNLDNGQRSLLAQLFAALIGDNDNMKPERIGFETERLLEWIQRVKFNALAMRLPDLADLVELFHILHSLFQSIGRPGTSGDVTAVSVNLPGAKSEASDDDCDIPI